MTTKCAIHNNSGPKKLTFREYAHISDWELFDYEKRFM